MSVIKISILKHQIYSLTSNKRLQLCKEGRKWDYSLVEKSISRYQAIFDKLDDNDIKQYKP